MHKTCDILFINFSLAIKHDQKDIVERKKNLLKLAEIRFRPSLILILGSPNSSSKFLLWQILAEVMEQL